MIKRGVSYYQSQGHYDAKIDYTVTPLAENQVDLTFQVDEGRRIKIRGVKVRGLKALEKEEVLAAIKTSRYKWWNSWLYGTGRLNREMLQADKGLIRQFFLDHGYIDSTIEEPVIERKKNGLYVTFHVTEGEQYKVGKVEVSGDLIDDSVEKTRQGIKIESGDVFDASKIREDTFRISDKFSDQGFAFTNVIPKTDVERNNHIVNINFAVDKGRTVTINRIRLTGNTKTYDHVIRREFEIAEQQSFSSSKVRRSEELLRRTGYFEDVSITPQQTENKDQVDLLVSVKEGRTGSLSAGAGYSSSDGALINARASENNFFGTGKSVSVDVDLGTRNDNVVVSYLDPRLNDSYWSFGTDILVTDRKFTDFDRKQKGGAINFAYPLKQFFGPWARDVKFGMEYEFQKIDIGNVDEENAAPLVIRSQGTTSASGITPKLTRSTIDNPLNPTHGSAQTLSVEATGLGGSAKYYLVEAKNTWYQPLWGREAKATVVSWRVRFDYGKTYDGDEFPLFRRFFPGGINSIRGFKTRTLGPADENGNEFGGNKQLVNNLEFIFPLYSPAGVKAVLFYDTGNAFDDSESIELSKFRHAVGYGIRWTSPLGPIRIEFGFPIDREEGESSMVTLFSFGAPF